MALAANSMEGKAQGYMERIEAMQQEIETAKGVYMAECKQRREDIREIFKEAKDGGVNVKALRGVIRHREMQRKLDAIPDGFDEDEAAAFEQLVDALGPLGFAAAKAKGYAKDDDDERDLRPRNLRTDQGRADEQQLAGVGRGQKSDAVDSLTK